MSTQSKRIVRAYLLLFVLLAALSFLSLAVGSVRVSAADILAALGGPLVHIVGHGAGRGDRIDTRNFGKRVRYVRGRSVAVHGLHLSCHVDVLL